jgi:hypothetical protein
MKSRAFLLALASLAVCAYAADKPAGDHSKLKTKEDKANAANWPDNSKGSPTPHAPAENPPAAAKRSPRPPPANASSSSVMVSPSATPTTAASRPNSSSASRSRA